MAGRTLIFVGLGVVAVGLALLAFPRAFAWFGTLPGDISLGRGKVRVFAPIASLLVLSVMVSLLLNAVVWLARKLGS